VLGSYAIKALGKDTRAIIGLALRHLWSSPNRPPIGA